MKIQWDIPPLIIIIPVVIVICVIIVVGIIAYFIWKKCYKWKVIPFKISEMATDDDVTLRGTSLSSLSSVHISNPVLSLIDTTVDTTLSSSRVTINENAHYHASQGSRSVTPTDAVSTDSKPKELSGKREEKSSDANDISEKLSQNASSTATTTTIIKNNVSSVISVDSRSHSTTATAAAIETKKDSRNSNFLRMSIKEKLSIKEYVKENEPQCVKENVPDDQGETKADEKITNFILDKSVMGWSLPPDLDPEILSELNKSLSPEITQKTDQCFQNKINEAVKIVQKMDFSLPEDATEEEKEKNRLAFHKMVWIVANDNRKTPSNL